ncbi:glucosyltransferase domain-containing protein [Oceanobacillus halophilus]|uniref:Glucosyltransferase GtrII-like protein n=1 Tax=Oceanobacillus halophilus TaxID=930130 RepID=A0A495A3W1_9BACI|nr:glucosyltransferase domain-containing protein [Oceanobacillus halophilus]RKQ34295.1 hypothetical protein D8M06_07905 [Oceanobacillus halophilus]
MPEQFFSKLKSMVKREWKIAFLSTVIIGFLTHMYVFTNMLLNHDGINNMHHPQNHLSSGRFFLAPFSGISSFFNLPWINGLLSIFYIALTVVALTEFYKLKKTPSIVLVAGIMVTFPTIASTFAYMYTADGYMAGLLLAILSLVVTKKFKLGFLPSSFLLFISVGIYQANLPIVLTAVLVWLIIELLFKQNVKETLQLFIQYVIMISIGMLLYVLLFKSYQNTRGIVDYQGLNSVGFEISMIPEQLKKIVNRFLDFFGRGFVSDMPINLFEILNIFLAILILIAVIVAIIRNIQHLSLLKTVSIILAGLLLPVAAFVLYFVSPGVSYHMLMVLALAFLYIFPIIIYDRLQEPVLSVKVFSWSAVVLLFLIVFNFAIISNISYFNMELRYEKSYAFMNRLLDRIEQLEGYDNVSQVAILGYHHVETNLSSNKVRENIPGMTGVIGETFLSAPYHFTGMWATFFGENFSFVNQDRLSELRENDLVQEMNAWPAKESVVIIDDVVVIKLSE